MTDGSCGRPRIPQVRAQSKSFQSKARNQIAFFQFFRWSRSIRRCSAQRNNHRERPVLKCRQRQSTQMGVGKTFESRTSAALESLRETAQEIFPRGVSRAQNETAQSALDLAGSMGVRPAHRRNGTAPFKHKPNKLKQKTMQLQQNLVKYPHRVEEVFRKSVASCHARFRNNRWRDSGWVSRLQSLHKDFRYFGNVR